MARREHRLRATAHDTPVRRTITQARGIARVRSGRGFRYVRHDGRPLKQAGALKRIRALAIPPAWRDVWISADPKAPLQATGRDARGRKQYLYHPDWRRVREHAKFGRLSRFPRILEKVRRAVRRDLARRVGDKRQVLAAVVRLLETTLARVGSSEYARHNGSFGLTTLRNHHATVAGSELQLRFAGKSGKRHDLAVESPRVARTVRACQRLPGELFVWVDSTGRSHDVTSADVNTYLREVSGDDLTAKDLRTWAGTLLAVHFLRGRAPAGGASRRDVSAVVRLVADRLHNTPAVCRKSYIHPRVIDVFRRPADDAAASRPTFPGRLSDEQVLERILASQRGVGPQPKLRLSGQ